MDLLKFTKIGETNRDETTNYSVEINKDNVILADIIEYVLSREKDWGYICINNFFSGIKIEYKYGSIISDNIPIEDKNRQIKLISASGGWSRMDYIINLI